MSNRPDVPAASATRADTIPEPRRHAPCSRCCRSVCQPCPAGIRSDEKVAGVPRAADISRWPGKDWAPTLHRTDGASFDDFPTLFLAAFGRPCAGAQAARPFADRDASHGSSPEVANSCAWKPGAFGLMPSCRAVRRLAFLSLAWGDKPAAGRSPAEDSPAPAGRHPDTKEPPCR